MKIDKYLSLILLLQSLRALFLLFFIEGGFIPLSPDEAQYWTWSQQLDIGYYSKPPGIAWQIALSSALLGDTELGVRAGSVLIGFLFPLSVFFLARAASLSQRGAFFAFLIAFSSPIALYLSFAATTDPASLLFASLALLVLAEGMKKEKIAFSLLGLSLFLGLPFKWNLLWFWLFLALLFPFTPSLRKRRMLGALFLSLLAFVPSVIWNMRYDWPTFRHVAKTVVRGDHGNPLDFFASQLGLFFPIYLILFFLSLFSLWKLRKKEKILSLLSFFSLGFFLFLFLSFFKKIQPNWAILFFPPMMVLAAWESEKRNPLWITLGTALAIISSAFAFAAPFLPLPYRLNPFRQCMGNNHLLQILERQLTTPPPSLGHSPKTSFLFSNKYQAVSLLSFYGPEKRVSYYLNISESRKSQFSYFEQMGPKERGKDGFFVLIENKGADIGAKYETTYLKALLPYFEQVDFVGAFPLYEVRGKTVKEAIVFKGIRYNGKMPEERREY